MEASYLRNLFQHVWVARKTAQIRRRLPQPGECENWAGVSSGSWAPSTSRKINSESKVYGSCDASVEKPLPPLGLAKLSDKRMGGRSSNLWRRPLGPADMGFAKKVCLCRFLACNSIFSQVMGEFGPNITDLRDCLLPCQKH